MLRLESRASECNVGRSKKRKASEIAEDADDADESVEETEAPAPQPRRRRTNVTDLGCGRSGSAQGRIRIGSQGAVKRERLGQCAEATGAALGTAAKNAKVAEVATAKRAEEAKAIAEAEEKASDEAAKEAAEASTKAASGGVVGTPAGDGGHPVAAGGEGKQEKASANEAVVRTEANVSKAKVVRRWWAGTSRGWTSVESEYVRDITRCLTVVNAFDETTGDTGRPTLPLSSGMQLARVSFHPFDKLKGVMLVWLERECLERWTVLCNDETLLEYIEAFLWTLVQQGSRRHGRLLLIAGRLVNSLSNFAGVLRQNHGRLDAWSIAVDRLSRKYALARLAHRTADPQLSIAIPRSRSRGQSTAPVRNLDDLYLFIEFIIDLVSESASEMKRKQTKVVPLVNLLSTTVDIIRLEEPLYGGTILNPVE
ncbi:hypothetical protein H257_04155 [Aphanomyces astaci]|uniref:Uncharacterized protein n=1 Tax=Aphanomyces astaci TaxID=112090 RepID=W4GWY7_APHAT|nr:hypothetical protein H257_04155 [Aphanomyces astaci]ETV83428.1 hypothetical protein H257_04155 [Aphanomyces astaci]|eukprot:XP_009826858.1 hypothetical protein H257_04155 [Aphanomyces astaci]